jgi:hypothetical protein
MRAFLMAGLATLSLLVACGGGGGDSGPEPLRFGAASPTTLEARITDVPSIRPRLVVSASYSGSASGAIFVRVEDPDGLVSDAVPLVGDGRASLEMEIRGTPAPGRYTRPLTIRVCPVADCSREFAGSPLVVQKLIVVEAIQVGSAPLQFSSPVGVAPAAQTLAVSVPEGRTFGFSSHLVQYQQPNGSSGLIEVARVFDIRQTPTGLLVQPKPLFAGRFELQVFLNSNELAQKSATLIYEVSGKSVQALSFPKSEVAVTSTGGASVFVDLDALRNIEFVYPTEFSFSRFGSPDPVQTDWLQVWSMEPVTLGDGPAGNGYRLRLRLSPCDWSGSNCLAPGVYTGIVRLEVRSLNEIWPYEFPVRFTVQ